MNATATLKKTFDALKGGLGYKNVMQAPKVVKVVVSTGVGKVNKDKKRLELIVDRLSRITGQAPAVRESKKAIANFKSRQGDIVGYQVTLRGERAGDFRGISPKAIDEMGNITLGIKEHTVFPETADEDAKDIFGLAVTIATTAKNKKEAEAFLRHIGLPLQTADNK
jgi:large subunit ribosomal protein L5